MTFFATFCGRSAVILLQFCVIVAHQFSEFSHFFPPRLNVLDVRAYQLVLLNLPVFGAPNDVVASPPIYGIAKTRSQLFLALTANKTFLLLSLLRAAVVACNKEFHAGGIGRLGGLVGIDSRLRLVGIDNRLWLVGTDSGLRLVGIDSSRLQFVGIHSLDLFRLGIVDRNPLEVWWNRRWGPP